MEEKNISKLISYILRHNPMKYNLKMDSQGYVNTKELVKIIQSENKMFTLEETENILNTIVETDKKQRFSYSNDKTMIRANQGHSLDFVNINFTEVIPDCKLYHGTTLDNYNKIKNSGLKPMKRHYVHLTPDLNVAIDNAKRWNKPFVILEIDCENMIKNNINFYKSENNVYLVKEVLPEYIKKNSY